jgi:hypothetical protein
MSTLSKVTTILIGAVTFSAVGYLAARVSVHYLKVILAKSRKGIGRWLYCQSLLLVYRSCCTLDVIFDHNQRGRIAILRF